MGRNYWMLVDTKENFEITRDMGYTMCGLGSKYRRRAQRMQPDDRILFYVTPLRKWTAAASVASKYFEDRTPIWKSHRTDELFQFRVQLEPLIVLDEEDYIDALLLAPGLEYVKRWAPEDWPLAFFDRLHLLPQKDYRLIETEMKRNQSGRKRAGRGRRPPSSGRREGSQDRANAGRDDQPATDDSSETSTAKSPS